MNTCDTCKWWGESAEYSEYRVCENTKLDDGKRPDGAQPEALDDTGIHFATGPKFGCIHWQLKHWQPSPEELKYMEGGTD